MTELCPYCGKSLEDGEVCSCSHGTAAIEQDTSVNTTLETSTSSTEEPEIIFEKTASSEKSVPRFTPENKCCKHVSELYELVICFFMQPLSFTLKNYRRISFSTSVALISIKALTAAIFSLILIRRLIGGYSRLLPTIDRILGLGGFFKYWGSSIHIPYVEIFIKIFLLVFILFFILAGLFYISGKLFGNSEGSFTRVFSVLSITSIACSAAFILASLFLLFVPPFAAFIILFAFLFQMILNHFGTCDLFDICQDTGIYSTSLVYLIFCLVLNLFTIQTLKISLSYLF